MFCAACGKEMPANSQFCPSCGHTVGQAAAPSATPVTAPTTPPPAVRTGGIPTWAKVLIGVSVGFVALIALVITLAFQMTSGLVEPVDRHFAALKAGNYEAAYAELAVATQKENSLADFKAMVQRNLSLTHVVGHSYSSRTVENGEGNLKGMLEIEGGGNLPITVKLVKEGGQWRILSYHVSK